MEGVVAFSPTLAMLNKATGEKSVYEIDQDSIEFGRDHANFVVLDSRAISRRHAQVQKQGEQFFITDLKSSNGTFLNNKKLPSGEKAVLRAGDMICIEDFEFCFQPYTENPDLYEATDTDMLEVKMIKKILKAIDKENAPFLEVTGGQHKGKKMILEGKVQEIIIGRDEACEFVIKDEVISRKHVRIVKKWDTVTIHDLGSKNKTYINSVPVEEAVLNDGDIILLGTLPILYRNPQSLNLTTLAPKIPKVAPPPKPSVEKSAPFEGRGSGRTESPVQVPAEAPHHNHPVHEPSVSQRLPIDPPFYQRLSSFEIIMIILGLGILGGALMLLVSLL
jgi:pSer/pThr/pTyr-binding forkhead associated (FHA) protein